MFCRNDPRLRRTLNELSHTIESANESAQAGLFTFNQQYIAPCLGAVGECVRDFTEPCFGSREESLRRQRRRTRGRAELSFDFYDDWEDDEDAGILGWSDNDELDRLLAGSGSVERGRNAAAHGVDQPGRQRAMSYGTRGGNATGRRISAMRPHDAGPDPTMIPRSSAIGFLGRWKMFGGQGLRYKPSAADLTENPGGSYHHRGEGEEAEPLIDEHEEQMGGSRKAGGRERRNTGTSGHTADSLSSRGDIFPSEDELDDAQPLDDEFAMVLERRTTGLNSEEASSRKSQPSLDMRSTKSRVSIRTASSKSTRDGIQRITSTATMGEERIDRDEAPSLAELEHEEYQARNEEEAEIEQKRFAAQALASQKGLASNDQISDPNGDALKSQLYLQSAQSAQPAQSSEPRGGTEAFPQFDVNAQPAPSPQVSEPVSPAPETSESRSMDGFVPARLPRFGHD